MTVETGSRREKSPRPPEKAPDPKEDRVVPVSQTNDGPRDPATAVEGGLIQQIDKSNLILESHEVLPGGGVHRNPDDNAVQGQEVRSPILETPVVLLGGEVGVNLGEDAVQGQGQEVPGDPMIIEEEIVRLVNENQWDEVEAYLMRIIDIPEPLEKIIDVPEPIILHPVLFLHVRRSKLLHLIDSKRVEVAATYFVSHIRGPFDQVKGLGQERLPFASVRYLNEEINFCGSCVTVNARKEHPHGDKGIMQYVICDYFRLNIPTKIRHEEPPSNHKMWQFGIRAATPPGNRKASIRCMACQHIFHKESIGILKRHLRTCFMMKTQYLNQLLQACGGSMIPVAIVPAQGQRRAHTTSLAQHPVTPQVSISVAQKSLPIKDCVLLYKENLSSAQMIKTKIAEGSPDPIWPKLLGTALANVEAYGDVMISALGQAVQVAPSAQSVDPQTELIEPQPGTHGGTEDNEPVLTDVLAQNSDNIQGGGATS